ncbi:unnamed protein product [Mesocestoides corti]|uniref:coproporphyrinogen oxidase n=1 Tax=Mesocestoides corti TaxID=53468 RepID=A0A0R3U4W7_MESCO|nr:unnamed protein product [Mesocestoides corti]
MEAIDGKAKFVVDRWMRDKNEGGGISCVLQDGEVFEKAGVNISVITTTLSEAAIKQMKERFVLVLTQSLEPFPYPPHCILPEGGSKDLESGGNYKFTAVGISSVNHPLRVHNCFQILCFDLNRITFKRLPNAANVCTKTTTHACFLHCQRNPHAPTMHFNFRYFEVVDVETGKSTWWFGGGCDLTPSYLYDDDARHFHLPFKAACDAHNPTYYADFKKWCDDYFFIKHRGEFWVTWLSQLHTLIRLSLSKFCPDCAAAVAPAYLPIVVKRRKMPFTAKEKEWQLIRRGRYVEFNLIYDRGTKFGLFTPNARYESIFVSMPLYAKWVYCHDPSDDPRHIALLDVLKHPREWV